MKVGCLFAGIGGFELASQWMGWENIWSNEYDKHACKVLRKNFKHEIIEADIRRLSANSDNSGNRASECEDKSHRPSNSEERKHTLNGISGSSKRIYLAPVDLICGGFPCQPFSHAGKRNGTDDDRYLWPEFIRIIRELKPSYVVGENVVGLLTMEDGGTFEQICVDLENEGYTVESFIIPAASVGAWHRRDRVWIIGYSNVIRTVESNNRGIQKEKRNKSTIKRASQNGNATDSKCINGKGKGKHDKPVDKEAGGDRKASGLVDEFRGEIEPGVRRVANGLSQKLDRRIWERGHPEPTTTKTKGRAERLKQLGNAVVPQVVLEIFKVIEAYETTNKT